MSKVGDFYMLLFWVSFMSFFSSCESENGQTRIFEDITIIKSIDLDPPLIRISSEGEDFYGYFYHEKQLIKLNSDFEAIESLGGFGDGPKENLLVRNYQVLEDGKIALFDTEKNTFKIQDFLDSVYYYHKFF